MVITIESDEGGAMPSGDGSVLSSAPPPSFDPRFQFNVSVPPVRFVASFDSGWDGAFLADGSAAPTGEARHDHQTVVIQHWLTPNPWRPVGGAGGWTTLEPGVRVRFPGDAEHGEWSGSPRSRFLFVTPERVRAVLGTPWDASGLTRWRAPRHRLPFVEHVLGAMMRDLEAGYPAGPLTGDALVVALLHHLNGGDVERAHEPSRGALGRRLDAVIAHVEANLARPLPLAELASLAGVGVRRFGSIFAAETGWSPHRYVLYRRIERAKDLMRDPGLPLAQIASAVGFTDPTQFSRVFRQFTGEAPRTYRRR
jgi:AraC family transcriptional regulator